MWRGGEGGGRVRVGMEVCVCGVQRWVAEVGRTCEEDNVEGELCFLGSLGSKGLELVGCCSSPNVWPGTRSRPEERASLRRRHAFKNWETSWTVGKLGKHEDFSFPAIIISVFVRRCHSPTLPPTLPQWTHTTSLPHLLSSFASSFVRSLVRRGWRLHGRKRRGSGRRRR